MRLGTGGLQNKLSALVYIFFVLDKFKSWDEVYVIHIFWPNLGHGCIIRGKHRTLFSLITSSEFPNNSIRYSCVVQNLSYNVANSVVFVVVTEMLMENLLQILREMLNLFINMHSVYRLVVLFIHILIIIPILEIIGLLGSRVRIPLKARNFKKLQYREGQGWNMGCGAIGNNNY
jgi:hypothetical protein